MTPTPAEQEFRALVAIEVAAQVAKMLKEIRAEIQAEGRRLDQRIDLMRRSLLEGDP